MSFLKRKKKEKVEELVQEESVESILSEIKSIVSGGGEITSDVSDDDSDILELTEIVETKTEQDISSFENIDEEKIISEADAPIFGEESQSEEDKFVDVLAEIDSELSDTAEQISSEEILSEEDKTQHDVLEEIKRSFIPKAEVTEPKETYVETVIQEEIIPEEVVVEEPINQQPEEILAEPALEVQEFVAPVEEVVTLNENQVPVKQDQIMAEENQPKRKESLLSKEKADISSQAIKELMHNIQRPKVDSPEFRGGFTVEDLVSETLKPLLKQWLDTNLEIIVRDVVEREIRKIIPREE